jgi:hypothetical protein
MFTRWSTMMYPIKRVGRDVHVSHTRERKETEKLFLLSASFASGFLARDFSSR